MNRSSFNGRRNKHASRQGAILPLMAFVLVAILIVIGLAINSNWLQLRLAEKQAAADLASMAAISSYADLPVDSDRVDRARDMATKVRNLNERVAGSSNSQIEFGFLSDADSHNPEFVQDSSSISAARAFSDDEDVPVFLGSLMGRDNVELSAVGVTAIRPIQVVLCLDASRSMVFTPARGRRNEFNRPPRPGSRWFILMERTRQFIDSVQEINPNAEIGLVTFGGGLTNETFSPLDATPTRTELGFQLASDSQVVEVMDRYVGFDALGLGTFIFQAINESMDLVEDQGNGSAERFIILLSDGNQVTRDNTPPPAVAARRAANSNIKIHTINFQQVPNPELLDVARVASGDSFDAANSDELEAAFEELLSNFRPRLAN